MLRFCLDRDWYLVVYYPPPSKYANFQKCRKEGVGTARSGDRTAVLCMSVCRIEGVDDVRPCVRGDRVQTDICTYEKSCYVICNMIFHMSIYLYIMLTNEKVQMKVTGNGKVTHEIQMGNQRSEYASVRRTKKKRKMEERHRRREGAARW